MADLLGRRRMFMLGLVVFSLASFAGGIAQSEAWLIAARGVQGLGAAIVSPAALSIITTTFADGPERNRALGHLGRGGRRRRRRRRAARRDPDQRPELALGVVRQRPDRPGRRRAAPRVLVESRSDDAGKSFDIPGAVTVTAGLALLVYAVVEAVNDGWGSTVTILRLAGAAVLLIAFVLIEMREKDPLMPFSIFRLRTLRGANIVGLLIGMSLFSMFFFISLYLQEVLGFSPIKTGVSYLPLAVGIIISAGLVSQIVNRLGFKTPLIAGLVMIAAALYWFSKVRAPGGSYVADVLGPSILAAVGLGFAFVPVTIAAVTAPSRVRRGSPRG